MSGVPDGKLNICLRGADDNGVPKYDWECAFMSSMTATLNYLETSVFHATTIGANLSLTNTGIWNVDPQFNTENQAPAS